MSRRGGVLLTQESASVVRPRKRRPLRAILALVVALGVLAVVAELLAQAMVPAVVRSLVIEKLELPPDQQLDVRAYGVLLPQLLDGQFAELHLASEAVTLDGVTVVVDVTATRVGLDGQSIGEISGALTLDESQFSALLARADLPLDSITFDAPNARVSGTAEILGAEVPVSATVTPSVVDGRLWLTPVALDVGELRLDAVKVEAMLGSLGRRLTDPYELCIADRLPAGVAVTGLTITDSTAQVDVAVDGEIFVDSALLANGVCS